jgi:hypothetical protein
MTTTDLRPQGSAPLTPPAAPPPHFRPRLGALRGITVLFVGPLLGYAASVGAVIYGIRAARGRNGVPRALAGLLTGPPRAYFSFVRPRMLHWGATEEESRRPLPGDEAVPAPIMATTRAITIAAPTDVVWSWLIQIGQGRGGFYSYDWLENAAGCDIHSADRIVPELQHPRVGEPINLAPGMGLAIAAIEPGRSLLLRPPAPTMTGAADAGSTAPRLTLDSTWAFTLDAIDTRTTRLIARFRVGGAPRAPLAVFCRLLLEPEHFVMERAMLRGIKCRAEASQQQTPNVRHALDSVRRFNRRTLNPAMLAYAARRHGTYPAIVRHVGRRSQRAYATPVVAEPIPGGFLIPLPYGVDVDWCRNVREAGRCTIERGGVTYPVDTPVVVAVQDAAALPGLHRRSYRLFGIDHLLRLRLAPAADDASAPKTGEATGEAVPARAPVRPFASEGPPPVQTTADRDAVTAHRVDSDSAVQG